MEVLVHHPGIDIAQLEKVEEHLLPPFERPMKVDPIANPLVGSVHAAHVPSVQLNCLRLLDQPVEGIIRVNIYTPEVLVRCLLIHV